MNYSEPERFAFLELFLLRFRRSGDECENERRFSFSFSLTITSRTLLASSTRRSSSAISSGSLDFSAIGGAISTWGDSRLSCETLAGDRIILKSRWLLDGAGDNERRRYPRFLLKFISFVTKKQYLLKLTGFLILKSIGSAHENRFFDCYWNDRVDCYPVDCGRWICYAWRVENPFCPCWIFHWIGFDAELTMIGSVVFESYFQLLNSGRLSLRPV